MHMYGAFINQDRNGPAAQSKANLTKSKAMKLIRTNPSTALSRVSDFDDWFRSPFAGLPGLSRFFDWESFLGQGRLTGSLATDIHEDKDNYYARFEVPGVKKDDVK